MAKMPFRASAFLAATCAAVPLAATVPAHADAGVAYRSCLQVRQNFPSAPDGTYLLSDGAKLFTVYCADMTTAPKEYVTLERTGSSENYSQYTAGGASPGTNVRTTFTRLRLDPAAFTVDIGDLKFATSTGSLRHSGSETVTSMPYAVAMSCTGTPVGEGNIDLRGTAVRVDNTFATGGAGPSGTATVSPDAQTVALRGGGFCGWIMPTPVRYNPFNPSPGMPNLKLDCTNQIRSERQICLRLTPAASPRMQVTREGSHRLVHLRPGGSTVAVLDLDGRVRSLR
ncbi:GON domain-containing protein [Actinomadura verrucosospora]